MTSGTSALSARGACQGPHSGHTGQAVHRHVSTPGARVGFKCVCASVRVTGNLALHSALDIHMATSAFFTGVN